MRLDRLIRHLPRALFAQAAALAGTLLATGCQASDTNVNRVYPDLTVTPTALDFGGVAVLYSGSGQVTVINSGLAVLDITDVRIDSEQGNVFDVDTHAPVSLAKDEQLTLTIRFQPETYAVYAGTLTILSNDEENPELILPLSGEGIYAPTPDIELSPPSYDFGNVAAGETAFATIDLANVGDATLTLGNLVQVGSSAFTRISSDPSGYSIPGRQSATLVFAYSPTHGSGDNAIITIPSDDPDEPELVLPLLGNGGGDFQYPIAVIDCPPTIVPRQIVYLDGSGSSDPAGGLLSYAWTIPEVPSGSDAKTISDDTATIARITPDIAGEYEVQLVVMSSSGVASSPATCRMDAIPDEDFHVELSWDGTSADLDLHVLTSAGSFFDSPYDCNFCNQSPAWGPDLSTSDDPSLDIDDQYGFGPENTNIDSPVEDVYHIMVHYFAENSDEAVVATVRVYSYGAKVAELSSPAMELNHVWEPGVVNWVDGADDDVSPDGTFGVIDAYYENLDRDAEGNPVDVDADGIDDRGPVTCY